MRGIYAARVTNGYAIGTKARFENARIHEQTLIRRRQSFARHGHRVGGIAAFDGDLLWAGDQDHRSALGAIGDLPDHIRIANPDPALATRTLDSETFHGEIPARRANVPSRCTPVYSKDLTIALLLWTARH